MNEEVEITLLQDDVTVETPLVADYILPTATSSTLGGVKIGDNIDIDSVGAISVPIATDSSVGLVKAGTGLAVSSDGTLTATGTYDLPEATKNTLGGVYVDDLTNTGNALTTLQGTVDPLVVNYDEAINGTAIDDTIWTNGDVRIYRRGRTGVIYVNLQGSLTIADGTSEIIHTIADSDNFPTIESIAFLSSDAGWLETVVNTDGEIVVYNNSGASITLTELKGNIPVVWL